MQKVLKFRAAYALALLVVAALIFVAIWMHRTVTDRFYSCLTAPCPFQWTFGYPVIDRLGVVGAGMLADAGIVAIGTFARHHFSDDDHRQLDAGLGAGTA